MNNNEKVRVFDGHNDTLLDLYSPNNSVKRSFFERSENGHIDLPRAIDGDFAGGFFAIFVPPERSPRAPTKRRTQKGNHTTLI